MVILLSLFSDWALLAARLVLAAIFLAHGLPKLKSLKTTAQNFEMMGFKPGIFWGTIVAVVEFVGGLAVLVGLYTQLAAPFLAIDMLVAVIWKMKRGQKLVGGYELDLSIMSIALLLSTLGAGAYSLDNYWRIIL
ncbi:MAG: DoxX family protein [Patescibacteria group bacterium]